MRAAIKAESPLPLVLSQSTQVIEASLLSMAEPWDLFLENWVARSSMRKKLAMEITS